MLLYYLFLFLRNIPLKSEITCQSKLTSLISFNNVRTQNLFFKMTPTDFSVLIQWRYYMHYLFNCFHVVSTKLIKYIYTFLLLTKPILCSVLILCSWGMYIYKRNVTNIKGLCMTTYQ